MKKIILKICSIVLLTITLVSLCLMGGCGKPKGYYNRKDLEEAYESGWITQAQLKSLAYAWNKRKLGDEWEPEVMDFEVIPVGELDEEVEYRIKMTHLNYPGLRKKRPNSTVKDISWLGYYGTFNGYVVAFADVSFLDISYKRYEEMVIGGVTFYKYTPLKVYDTNQIIKDRDEVTYE